MGERLSPEQFAARYGGGKPMGKATLSADQFRAMYGTGVGAPSEPRSFLQSLADPFIGAVKGAGTTASKVMRTGALDGILGPAASMLTRDNPYNVALEPEGTGQRAGFAAEQVGEFLLPGGVMKGAASTLGRAGLEALGAGGVAAVQSEGDMGEAGKAAAFGAAGPVVGKAVSAAAGPIRKAAEVQYGRALNATTKGNKRESARIVPELLDRRVRGTLEGLAEKGAEKSASLGKKLEKTYVAASDAGVKTKTAPIIKRLDKVKERFFAKTDAGEAVAVNPAAVAKVEAMQELVGKFADEARPDQIWALRKNIDDIIEGSGGFAGPVTPGTAKSLQRHARTAIQKELNQASPRIEKLNAEFSLWKGLETVSQATIDRKIGQAGIVELGIRSGLGGSLGLLLGGDSEWGAVGTALGAVTKHPLYRTVSAVEKARLAHALSKGQAQTATSILARISAGLAAGDRSSGRQPMSTP